ncbi:MAG: VWA domain-containing protein [Salinarimonas sp.]
MSAGEKDRGHSVARGGETRPDAPASSGGVEGFLEQARSLAPAPPREGRGRLVFALDATMSRQPTWDLACGLQTQMFETASEIGGLDVQLLYFRGFGECRASRWVGEPKALTGLMSGIAVRGGQTQIARALAHVRKEGEAGRVDAFVYVGDAFEDEIDTVCARAGELGLLGIKGFVFQEGGDPAAERALREIARLTGGAYARFDAAAPGMLAGLLRAAAAYASGGREGLARLAAREPQARGLLADMKGGPGGGRR